MKIKGLNPFLPNYEYIPDAEPRIFNDRVYIYGSHDKFNGLSFCLNDYVSYSAPVDDLTDWRYEGVIYKKSQDPDSKRGLLNVMFAPDVIKGLDNKYYMYYTIAFKGKIGVAVCDEPAGEYQFLGYVKYNDNKILGSKNEPIQFDPGIFIDDDNRIYLYSGFAPKKKMFLLKGKNPTKKGAMVFELEKDMLTIKNGPNYIAKTVHNSAGTDYLNHEFFEAPSMRKINNLYYFIYSSINGHELCYAVSKKPDRDFEFGGILVSIADLGISDIPLNYTGNTHGSLLELKGKYYIFYHRQTNRNSFSRQACAEEIEFKNAKFIQAEITTQGLSSKPLNGIGIYGAFNACNLFSKKGTYFYGARKRRSKYHPYFTQFGKDRENNPNQHIANFSKNAYAGFKYFNFTDTKKISINVKGRAAGIMLVSTDINFKNVISRIQITPTKKFKSFSSDVKEIKGVFPLYFSFNGKGRFRFMSFELM